MTSFVFSLVLVLISVPISLSQWVRIEQRVRAWKRNGRGNLPASFVVGRVAFSIVAFLGPVLVVLLLLQIGQQE